MNIKCFSDLEKWMQGIVFQVKAATGTTEAVCVSVREWHSTVTNNCHEHSIWVAEHNKHYNFTNYRELCNLIEGLARDNHRDKLYRRFEL